MRKIVVATDGSEIVCRAVRTALELAATLKKQPEVHVVSVVDYADVPRILGKAPADAPDLLAMAQRALDNAAVIALELNAPVTLSVLRGNLPEAILKYARAMEADVIVMGTHGRNGIQRAFLGSGCEAVVRKSEIPVLTVRGPKLTATAPGSAHQDRGEDSGSESNPAIA